MQRKHGFALFLLSDADINGEGVRFNWIKAWVSLGWNNDNCKYLGLGSVQVFLNLWMFMEKSDFSF